LTGGFFAANLAAGGTMPRTLFPLAALALCACGDNRYDLYEHEPESFRTIAVWVEPHPDIPPELARQACESWRPEGVLCEIVADPMMALVRIRSSIGPCEKLKDGTYPLGRAYGGGDITLEIECLRKYGGAPIAERVLWPVIAHEVGHELGIWIHVPTGCDGPDVMEHPEVGPVCGTALMNPEAHFGLKGITTIDHGAYGLREEDHSVLRIAPDEGCTFTARE